MTPKDPEKTRQRIIDATLQTLQVNGLGKFSLEEIAQQASVSKGGLLHHFPSKERLLEAAIQHLLHHFEALALDFLAQEDERPGRWLRAYIRASFADHTSREHSTLLLSFLADHAAHMSLIREDVQRWSDRLLNDGLPAARVMIVWRAADATWIDQVLGLTPDAALQQEVYDTLMSMTEANE